MYKQRTAQQTASSRQRTTNSKQRTRTLHNAQQQQTMNGNAAPRTTTNNDRQRRTTHNNNKQRTATPHNAQQSFRNRRGIAPRGGCGWRRRGGEEKRRGDLGEKNATQGQIKKGMEEARRGHYKEGKEDGVKTRCMWMEEWWRRGEEKQRSEEEGRREEEKRRVDSGGRNAGPGQIRKVKEEARRGHCKETKGNGKETRWMWMEEWRRRREEKRGFGSYLVRIFRSKQCDPELHTPVPERCSVEERVLVPGPDQNRYNTAAGSARQPHWSRDCSPDNAQRR